MSHTHKAHQHVLAALTALLLLSMAAPALAVKPSKPGAAPNCPTAAALEQPFLGFVPPDPAMYYLAPNASFEKGAWSGGTTAVPNEPYFVREGSERDRKSLTIVSPNTAISPDVCIGLDDPTLRFFARQIAGPPLSTLGVAVRYEGVTGGQQTVMLGALPSAGINTWIVSPQTALLPVTISVLPKALGTDPINGDPTTNAKLLFAPSAGSRWQIDDVFIDPYRHR